MLLILWLACLCGSGHCRVFMDPETIAKIPTELKVKLDQLIAQKTRLYLDTHFGATQTQVSNDKSEVKELEPDKDVPKMDHHGSRSRRDINDNRKDEIVCENSYKELKCDSGEIHIVEATFGRQSFNVCTSGILAGESACSVSVTEELRALCNKKSRCRLGVTRDFFGKPCQILSMYLEVKFVCRVHGRYSPWSEFTSCSATCDGGQQTRFRTCTNPTPANGGRNCSDLGPSQDVQVCANFPCIPSRHHILDKINPLQSIPHKVTHSVKGFSFGGFTFLCVLTESALNIYHWNNTINKFVVHQPAIYVHNGTDFDTFIYNKMLFLVLSECKTIQYQTGFVSRVLMLEDNAFVDKLITPVPVPRSDKVVITNADGKLFAVYIQYKAQSTSEGIAPVVICEGTTGQLSCPQGTIIIKTAFFGRNTFNLCPIGIYYYGWPCQFTVTEKVYGMCNGKTSCTLYSHTSVFGKPCAISSHYLHVYYGCEVARYKNSPYIFQWQTFGFQSIPYTGVYSYGATDLEAFDIHGRSFLALANHINDDLETHINSEIFVFSLESQKFESLQQVRTDAIMDWEFFTIGQALSTEYFLIAANHYRVVGRKRNYDTNSIVYKFNWNHFVPFQCLRLYGALKFTSTKGRNNEFLLIGSGLHYKVVFFQYDGWRFFESDFQPQEEVLSSGVLSTHIFQTMNYSHVFLHVSTNNVSQSNVLELDFVAINKVSHFINVTVNLLTSINHTVHVTLKQETDHMRKLLEDSNLVYRNQNNSITGLKIVKHIVSDAVTTVNGSLEQTSLTVKDQNFVDGINVVDSQMPFLEKHVDEINRTVHRTLKTRGNQVITESIVFTNLTYIDQASSKDIIVQGHVNDINITRLAAEALYIDKNDDVYGNKTFSSALAIDGDVTVQGLVDQVNTSDLVTLKSDHVITATKKFLGDIEFRSNVSRQIKIQGLLNGLNFTRKKVFLLDGAQTISGSYTFRENCTFSKDFHINKTLNELDLSRLHDNAVFVDEQHNITGYMHFSRSMLLMKNLKMETGEKIDGVDVSELEQRGLSLTKNQTIAGNVSFQNGVQFLKPVELSGTLNGLNVTDDIVYLSEVQKINGTKYFLNDVILRKNMQVNGTVDGIGISGDLLTVHRNQTLSGAKTFQNGFSVQGDILMDSGKTVDGIDVSELAADTVYIDAPQTITGNKTFQSMQVRNVTIGRKSNCKFVKLLHDISTKTWRREYPAYINGSITIVQNVSSFGNVSVNGFVNRFRVPDDLMLRSGDQQIRGEKTFQKTVAFKDDVNIDGLLNGYNLSDIYRRALRLNGSHTITGAKTFTDDVTVLHNLTVAGSVDGLYLPNQVVLLHGDQNITGNKVFLGNVTSKTIDAESIVVGGLVDGVNITYLNMTALRTTKLEQTIVSEKIFTEPLEITGNMTILRLANGVNLTHFNNTALKTYGDQTVTGKKVFKSPVTFKNNITAEQLVDGVNLTDLLTNSLYLKGRQTISGAVHFTDDVNVRGNVQVDGNFNGVNITTLRQDVLYKKGNQIFTSQPKFKKVTIRNDVVVNGTVNGIDLSEEVATLSGNEEITSKYFQNDILVEGDIILNGTACNVDLSALNSDTLKLNQSFQIVNGEKNFTESVTVEADVNAFSLVDGVNISHLNTTVLRKTADQELTGFVVFKDNVELQADVTLSGVFNGKNLSQFIDSMVLKSKDQEIQGLKSFKGGLHVAKSLIADNVIVTGRVNNIDISEVKKNSVMVDEDREIFGAKTFAENVVMRKALNVSGTVDGLKIPDNIIILSKSDSISGAKTFSDVVTINGNLDAETNVTINGIDISQLAANALYLNATAIVTSPVEFGHLSFKDHVNVHGHINDVNVSSDHLLLRSWNQTVTGKKVVKEIVALKNLDVVGYINRFSITSVSQTTVKTNESNTITGRKTLRGDLDINGDLQVRLIDGINVTDMYKDFIQLENSTVGIVNKLNFSITQQASVISSLRHSLQDLHQTLDFFTEVATLSWPDEILTFDVMTHENNTWLFLPVYRNYSGQYCSESSVYRWNSSINNFTLHHKVSTNGITDVALFQQGNLLQASIATGVPNGECSSSESPGDQKSKILFFNKTNLRFMERDGHAVQTYSATRTSLLLMENSSVVITYTNTQNSSARVDCANVSLLLVPNASSPSIRSVAHVLSCQTEKAFAVRSKESGLKIILLASALYGENEAMVYSMSDIHGGNISLLQRIPTTGPKDAKVIVIDGNEYLIITNHQQSGCKASRIDYSLPVKIYRSCKETKKYTWFQDIEIAGASYLESFQIDRNHYLAIASVYQEIRIYKFLHYAKFAHIHSIPVKGLNSILAIKSWKMRGELYLGVLVKFPERSKDVYTIKILNAVKYGKKSVSQLKTPGNIFAATCN